MKPQLEKILGGLQIKELVEARDKIDEMVQTMKDDEKRRLKEEFASMAQESGLSLDEIFPGKEKPGEGKTRKPVKAKYQNPDTGDTWSGRGRTPKWVTEAEEGGTDRVEFLIDKG